jgi:phytoene dehydrogenase-like protein
MERYDAVIAGGGHNGLVAAALLGRAGWSVCVLERRSAVGGAAVSAELWPGVDARVSRYAYLVSLFPSSLRAQLGLGLELRRRDGHEPPSLNSAGVSAWRDLTARAAGALAPTLTEPLRAREDLLATLDGDVREALFEAPLAEALERYVESDEARGLILTDGLIGTFASAADPSLRQNRCYLYHVIGDGIGRWDVPVGGMGAVTDELARIAREAGVVIRADTEVEAIDADAGGAEVSCAGAVRVRARHVLIGAGGLALPFLRGRDADAGRGAPQGAQLKINMLLARLPRLRDPTITPARAFAGTFHVNEGYAQLERAHAEAAAGTMPSVPPCELYCHSLTDPSILGPELRAAGAQTLTLFGLHMPAALFAGGPEAHAAAKARAVAATLRSFESVLAEPLEECLWRDATGAPCLEAVTPIELERELGMPGGHIFHRDLSWPFAEHEDEIGAWGVETALPTVWVCGAAARRGGGVSGIPGHNAARAVLAAG